MSMLSSPSITTNGLVFYYDMNNTFNSFKGAPTTNQVSNAASFSGWNYYWRTDYINTFTTEFGTTGYRITGNPSWNGLYRTFNLGSTGTYTFSAWFRYWGGTGNNNGATVYVSNYGGGDTAAGIDKNKVGIWQRISHTVSVTSPSNVYLYFISYGGDSSGRADCSTWDITMPQIESGSFATGFVDGTRSNTQALLDLTNNNTITAQSLTYASNETFSFNGSQYLSIPDNALIRPSSGYITTEVWFKATATGSQNGSILINKENEYEISAGGGYITYAFRPNWAWVGATAFNTNQNYCVTITYDQINQRMYLNGVEVYSAALTGAIGNVYSDTLKIGARGGTGSTYDYFTGNIYSVKIYNRALSASEVAQNFAAQRGLYGV